MLGTRHQNRPRAGLGLWLLSVSALLAFALFPAFAGAADSSELEYRDVPPPQIEHKKTQKNRADASDDDGEPGQSATQPGSTGDDGADDRSSTDGSGGGGKGGDDDKGGGAKPDKQGGDGGKAPQNEIDAAPASAEDDGSSPLVPILIALAVLAAISVGAVAMRRKRREADPGAPASTEAG